MVEPESPTLPGALLDLACILEPVSHLLAQLPITLVLVHGLAAFPAKPLAQIPPLASSFLPLLAALPGALPTARVTPQFLTELAPKLLASLSPAFLISPALPRDTLLLQPALLPVDRGPLGVLTALFLLLPRAPFPGASLPLLLRALLLLQLLPAALLLLGTLLLAANVALLLRTLPLLLFHRPLTLLLFLDAPFLLLLGLPLVSSLLLLLLLSLPNPLPARSATAVILGHYDRGGIDGLSCQDGH